MNPDPTSLSRTSYFSRLTTHFLPFSKFLPSPGSVLFTLLVAAGLLLYAHRAGAFPAQPPSVMSTNTLPYQGRLTDTDGNPINGTKAMAFRLYNVASGGSAVWSEEWDFADSVMVNNGLFNVFLGSLTPIPQNVIASNSSLWLGISIDTDTEMTPRVQVGSVPFAMQAQNVPDGAITTTMLADNAVTSNKLEIADGLAMTGNLTITGQITNTVNIMMHYETITTDGAGQANISPYLVVIKPAHFWMSCQGGQTYWNTDYDFDYNASVGQLSNLPPNCKVVIYYIYPPEGSGNPVHSPPDW